MDRERATEAIRAVLPPAVSVVLLDVTDEAATYRLGRTAVVRVVWIPRGWPQNVRHVLRSPQSPDLVVAPEMSPGGRELADAHGLSWVDETGAASIVAGDLVVVRDRQHPRPARRPPTWTPSALAVVEAVLTGTPASASAVAARTELAESTAVAALRLLHDQRLLTARAERGRHARRQLHDPSELLDQYAEQAVTLRKPLVLEVGIDPRDALGAVAAAGARWNSAGRGWAATSALAAALQGPYLQRPSPVEVYVSAKAMSGLQAAVHEAGLEPLPGGRLLLRPFPSEGTQRLTTSLRAEGIELNCVPWPRTFADLRPSGVRGEEAAEHLRHLHLPAPEVDGHA